LSNSTSFSPHIISDKTVRALLSIINFSREKDPTQIQIIASLVSILNFSTYPEILTALKGMKLLESL